MEKKMSKEEILKNLRKAKDEGLDVVIKVRTRNNETVMVPMTVPAAKLMASSGKAKCEVRWAWHTLDIEHFDRLVKYTTVVDERENQFVLAERYIIKNIEYVYVGNETDKDEEA